MSGLIRFVGGPLHNQIRLNPRRDTIDVLVAPAEPWSLVEPPPSKVMSSAKPDFSRVTYYLQMMCYGRVVFWEYHAVGEEGTEHSGGNGTTASWRVDGHQTAIWLLF